MKNIQLLVIFIFPLVCLAQLPPLASKKYSWVDPQTSQADVGTSILFEGSGHDMEFVQVSANAIKQTSKNVSMKVPDNEEHLIIVKAGTLTIALKDSLWKIGGGSIALLIPGEKYSLRNGGVESCTYYLMKYRSKLPVDNARGKASGGSFVKDWNKVVFKPHDRGGVRSYFERATAMSKRFEMHVTTLKPGLRSHAPHTHNAEEIILVIENKNEMQIDDKFYKGGTGDIYYIGSNLLHGIRNNDTGTCSYFAFQFE
jgi:(S)-ureidoglycine aminohydrolase